MRAHAALQLDAGDHAALKTLSRDSDASVRQAALSRLSDPDTLLAWHREAASPESLARLIDVIGGREMPALDLSRRLTLVDSVDEHALLDALVEQGDNQTLRLTALARIEDETRLIHHASDNGIAAVRLAAAERVSSPAGLSTLVKQAKRDKQVARLARERLARQRADAEQQAAASAERERLLEALEAHAHRPWEPTYDTRLKHWVKAWEALADGAGQPQHQRFDIAVARCRQRIAEHEHHHRELERVKREKAAAQATREGILEALEQALNTVSASEPMTAEAMEALASRWHLQSERWQSVSDDYGVSDAYAARHAELEHRVQTLWQAWERLAQLDPELRQALEQGDDTTPILARLDWPKTLPPTALVEDARRQAATAVAPQEAARDSSAPAWDEQVLGTQLDQLEAELESGRYRPAAQIQRQLRQQLDASTATLPAALEQRWKQLTARLAELRDWRGFVAAPKREELLTAIEALAEAHEQSDAERHRRHQQLIREWRQLGDAAANRELAQRFRAASDALHTQLAAWESELANRERDNLARREALCEQLETLLDNPAEDADPDALRRIRDAAQEQWDQHWPVPKRRAAALGRRFARLRQRLQTLIDARAGDNASHKRELVAEAQRLAEQEGPAQQRADQAKQLQQRWRELGRAPKGVEQTLWRQFRSHCDTIFAARDALRGEQQARQQQRFDAMQALIDKLDAWQPTHAGERDVLDAALAEAQRLSPLPHSRRSEGMERRWQGIVHAREVTLERLELVAQARTWPDYRRWLEQMIAGEALDPEPPAALRQRLQQRQMQMQTPLSAYDAEEGLQRCLVQLSLLAGEPIPETLEPLRLEVQVARLNDALGRPPTPPEELEQTLLRLFTIAPLEASLWARYASSFDALLGRLSRAGHEGVDTR
ncbi:DUF349 domain-containing protein [Salinicola sp. RZ23]|uniref:DUF349 domain-containing protein n=1 Tax=Salinicola sp. RZ23 TaxID=1949087 RepID=UPI0018E58864|nr:DUF349 domain-containing protein [Salinicola sp. RZ23]